MEDLQELPLFLEVHPRPVKFTRCTLPKIIYTCGGETKARNILVAPHAVVVVVVVVVVVAAAVVVVVVAVVVVVVVVVFVVFVVLVVLVVGECHVVALVPPWLLGSRARAEMILVEVRVWRAHARANPDVMLLKYS